MSSSHPQKKRRQPEEPRVHGRVISRACEMESLFAYARVGLAFFDREHRYLRINERLAEIHGLPVEAHIGRRIAELFPASARVIDPILDEVFRSGRTIEQQITAETSGEAGVTVHLLAGFYPVFATDNEPDAVGAYIVDLTHRIRAEEALRASEERFRALVNATFDVIYRMSPDWTEMRQLDGRSFLSSTQEAKTDWIHDYIHPEDQRQLLKAIQDAVRTRSKFELEHRVRRLDGSFGWTLSRAVPIVNERREIVEWFGAASDVTARKKAEEALIRSEKLASMGRMAATIAHEINNPLAAVMNLLFLAQHNPDCPQSITHDLAKAESELNRVSHITRQVLGFYRDSSQPAAVQVADVLDGALALFETKFDAKGVEIGKDYAPDVEIMIVAGELRQVLSNIIANSLDAVPDDGAIKLRIAEKTTPAGKAVVRITIADNGKGIDSSARPHIFEPLFTTKEAVGTGLGLWVSKQLVEKHYGSIRFRSSTRPERRGTTFVIELPIPA